MTGNDASAHDGQLPLHVLEALGPRAAKLREHAALVWREYIRRLEHPKVSGTVVGVSAVMSDRFGLPTLTLPRIVADTHYGRTAVRDALDVLDDLGLLDRSQPSRRTATRYVMTWPATALPVREVRETDLSEVRQTDLSEVRETTPTEQLSEHDLSRENETCASADARQSNTARRDQISELALLARERLPRATVDLITDVARTRWPQYADAVDSVLASIEVVVRVWADYGETERLNSAGLVMIAAALELVDAGGIDKPSAVGLRFSIYLAEGQGHDAWEIHEQTASILAAVFGWRGAQGGHHE
jgi:hypothetical protein